MHDQRIKGSVACPGDQTGLFLYFHRATPVHYLFFPLGRLLPCFLFLLLLFHLSCSFVT